MGNYYSRLDQQLPRTNHPCEEWYRAFQHSAGSFPSIYQSIRDLQMKQQATFLMAEQLQAGFVKRRRRAKYERLDEYLQHLVSSFDTMARDMYFKCGRALFHFSRTC